MRDRFKFRLWIKDMGLYFTKPCIFLNTDGLLVSDDGVKVYEIDQKAHIIEFCTGLKDKNGKLIYEGDILTDGANTFIVNWYDDMALFRLLYKNDNRETYCLFYPDDAASKYTVIGNIHEETEK